MYFKIIDVYYYIIVIDKKKKINLNIKIIIVFIKQFIDIKVLCNII